MKNIFLMGILWISSLAIAQEEEDSYFLINPLFYYSVNEPSFNVQNYGSDVKEVNVYQEIEGDKKLTKKYYFDKEGKHVKTFYNIGEPTIYRTDYLYASGKLKGVKSQSYTSPKNQQLFDEIDLTYDKLFKENGTVTNEEEIGVYERFYSQMELVDPENIEWLFVDYKTADMLIEYNAVDKMTAINIFSKTNRDEMFLMQRVLFEYNKQGQLSQRVFITIEHNEPFIAPGFIPEKEDFGNKKTYYKQRYLTENYFYDKESTRVEYYVNKKKVSVGVMRGSDDFSSREIIIDDEMVYFEIVGSIDEKNKSYKEVNHNADLNRFAEEVVWGIENEFEYTYDDDGRLIEEIRYDKDGIVSKFYYELIER